MNSCKTCTAAFQIDPEDLDFYSKIQVPPPTLCPSCRASRRLSFRNEKSLYKRTCDLCAKPLISIYPPDSKYKVYCHSCWFGDKWDGLQFGKDFDFSHPFFEQFSSLEKSVPHIFFF
ncbi:MAG: hypothetical protein WCT36_02200, partial [Candidatus Gracilibacteria bacterium]